MPINPLNRHDITVVTIKLKKRKREKKINFKKSCFQLKLLSFLCHYQLTLIWKFMNIWIVVTIRYDLLPHSVEHWKSKVIFLLKIYLNHSSKMTEKVFFLKQKMNWINDSRWLWKKKRDFQRTKLFRPLQIKLTKCFNYCRNLPRLLKN